MLSELTEIVQAGQDLDFGQAESALDSILSEETAEAEIAAFLVSLSEKGENPGEIAGFAKGMRRHAVRIQSECPDLVDTAGTGGGRETFNISTAAAFVIAGAGTSVAKHGNRAVTSRCGSADVLWELGVKIEQPPEVAERCLNEVGIAFLFAPSFHPEMKRVAGIRRSLGRRTIFNLLGPLTNPAGAKFQLVGVFSPELTEALALALAQLGTVRSWVVCSHDGLDELTVNGCSRVSLVQDGQVRSFDFDPVEHGFSNDPGPIPVGENPTQSAAIIRGILDGSLQGTARDIVLLNAAAALRIVSGGDSAEAVDRAVESLDSGAALEKLRLLVDYSKG